MNFLEIYLLFLSVISFLIFATDKFQAKNNRSRIPGNTLLTVTFLGGTFGSVLGMIIFRHKISKYCFISMILLYSVIKIINFKQIY